MKWIKRGSIEEYQRASGGYVGAVWKQDFFWTAHHYGSGENKGWFWTKRGAKKWVERGGR